MDALVVLLLLQDLYGKQNKSARYEISKELVQSRMNHGTALQTHILKKTNLNEQVG